MIRRVIKESKIESTLSILESNLNKVKNNINKYDPAIINYIDINYVNDLLLNANDYIIDAIMASKK